MSTIRTVSVPPGDLRPQPHDREVSAVTRAAYSIDGYEPVIVTIRIGGYFAWMRVTTSHSPSRNAIWRHPNTDQRRRLIDEALARVNMRRVKGERIEHDPRFGDNGWAWRVAIESTDPAVREAHGFTG